MHEADVCIDIAEESGGGGAPKLTNSDNRPAVAAKINQLNQNHLCQDHFNFLTQYSRIWKAKSSGGALFHKTVETEVADSEMFT